MAQSLFYVTKPLLFIKVRIIYMKLAVYTITFIISFSAMLFSNNNAGSLIITGFYGTSQEEASIQQLKTYIDQQKIGGILLYKRNIVNPKQLNDLVTFLTKDTDIFVAIDHEGGLVNRFDRRAFNIYKPSPEAFCKLPIHTQQFHALTSAKFLNHIGINLNLGGIADRKPPIFSSSICQSKRCLSDNAAAIETCLNNQISAYQHHDVYFAIKHFPGHGSTPVDSHYSLPDITKSHSPEDYMPYFSLNESANMKVVMIGHLLNQSSTLTYRQVYQKIT